MIIPKDVPFEKRAKFLHDSMCPYPAHTELAAALGKWSSPDDGLLLAEGLQAYHTLLQRIYTDTGCVEGKDDQAKCLNVIYTMAFLYAIFAHGSLVVENGRHSVRIDRTLLKQTYKKGGLARRKRHLEHHGFTIGHLVGEDECATLNKASHLSVAYDGHPDLVPALKLFAERIEPPAQSPLPASGPQMCLFLRANYGAVMLGEPIPRDRMDPLQVAVLNTIDAYRQPWTDLVNRFREECGLHCSGFWAYGGSPSWGVSFFAQGKRPLAIFTLGSDVVFIEFTLPVDAAQAIVQQRSSYADSIRERIEGFDCGPCPKACRGSNLVNVDGVSLCTGRAEARRIYTHLRSPQEFASIHAMLDIICRERDQ